MKTFNVLACLFFLTAGAQAQTNQNKEKKEESFFDRAYDVCTNPAPYFDRFTDAVRAEVEKTYAETCLKMEIVRQLGNGTLVDTDKLVEEGRSSVNRELDKAGTEMNRRLTLTGEELKRGYFATGEAIYDGVILLEDAKKNVDTQINRGLNIARENAKRVYIELDGLLYEGAILIDQNMKKNRSNLEMSGQEVKRMAFEINGILYDTRLIIEEDTRADREEIARRLNVTAQEVKRLSFEIGGIIYDGAFLVGQPVSKSVAVTNRLIVTGIEIAEICKEGQEVIEAGAEYGLNETCRRFEIIGKEIYRVSNELIGGSDPELKKAHTNTTSREGRNNNLAERGETHRSAPRNARPQ